MNESEIFAKVIAENDTGRRNEIIGELCGSDNDLRGRIQNLVDAHEQPDTFFADPVGAQHQQGSLDLTRDGESSATIGMQIGPYKLLQEIGEGGMGLVFMAEQTEPVKRRVALKIIKPGMDSRQIIARFEAERQALAMMDHPNIAKVLDAGTTEDRRPYFVMELVNGLPITEYCDEECLTTEQRLKIFTTVCRAVQHAHQKGVIHRDIKPGNILVAEFDGEPVAKVIDFGIAKATGPALTEKTLFTEFGQVVGTVEYMSPEQARRNQLDIDTRSDVYSLGVVLYKLLTGETPFGSDRLRQAAWDEILKIIKEERPELPSIKVGSNDSLGQIAKFRNVAAAKLPSQIKGDLDWIVSKSLEKNRDHRYQSASELADDVARHLNEQTVLAAPANSMERIRKYIRRNPTKFWSYVAAVIGFLALVYLGQRAADKLDKRNATMNEAVQTAKLTLDQAEKSVIGDESYWNAADSRADRINDLLNSGELVSRDVRSNAIDFLEYFEFKKSEREIAKQIEDVLIRGASNPDLASWKTMEVEIREFFGLHGFDLDNEVPANIGKKISEHRSSVMWADLLELWIGTLGHMASLGGPKVTATTMQPWADAIYIADNDPIRTGIRKFIYTPPPKRENLDDLIKNVNLKSLSGRTLAWLGTCYAMVGDQDEADRVLQIGLEQYPQDVMLAHSYGYGLHVQGRYQEATRMLHRCLVIRNDVPGLWISLAKSLEALGEKKAADRARKRAQELIKN